MPALDESFPAIVAALAERYAAPVPVGVAAGVDPFRALVAVLLSRVVDPIRAARGLDALADAGLLDPLALAEAEVAEIGDTLKSSGVNVPARGLALAEGTHATESLREELASLNGIGPATADALLLLGLNRPVYPLDRATYRVLVRHGWLDTSAGYDEARAVVEGPCHDDPETLARLSDWLERIGREFCRVGAPKCDRCPLRPFLPEGGPFG
jgi:endonuclease-3 related protein